MASVTYFRKWGFSINEGGGPMNIHMQWLQPWCWVFFYVFFFGARFHFTWKRRVNG